MAVTAPQKFKFASADTAKVLGSAEFKAAVANRANSKAFANSAPRSVFWPEGPTEFTPVAWDVKLDKNKEGKTMGRLYLVKFKVIESLTSPGDKGRTFTKRYSTKIITPKDKSKSPYAADVGDLRALFRACELHNAKKQPLTDDEETNEENWGAYLDGICGADLIINARCSMTERSYKNAEGKDATVTNYNLYNLKLRGTGAADVLGEPEEQAEAEAEAGEESAEAETGADSTDTPEEDAAEETPESISFDAGDKVTFTLSGKPAKGVVVEMHPEDSDKVRVRNNKDKKIYSKPCNQVTLA